MADSFRINYHPNNILDALIGLNVIHYIELMIDNTTENIDEYFIQKTALQALDNVRAYVDQLLIPDSENGMTYGDVIDKIILTIYDAYLKKDKTIGLERTLQLKFNRLRDYYSKIIELKNLDRTKPLSTYENSVYPVALGSISDYTPTFGGKVEEHVRSTQKWPDGLKKILEETSPLNEKVNKMIEEYKSVPGTIENLLAEKAEILTQLVAEQKTENHNRAIITGVLGFILLLVTLSCCYVGRKYLHRDTKENNSASYLRVQQITRSTEYTERLEHKAKETNSKKYFT